MFSRHRDAVVAEHRLEDVLVHAERRAEHAGADVRDAGELEQALHRPVLAERAVQHREDDVDVGERRRDLAARQALGKPCCLSFRARLERAAAGPSAQPPARSISTVTTSLPALLERRDHAGRGGDRDRVLARAAAEDDGDPPAHRRRGRRGGRAVRRRCRRPGAGRRGSSPPRPTSRRRPAPGPVDCTIPSWLGSVTGS